MRMLVVGNGFAVPSNRKPRVIPERRDSREAFSNHAELRFYKKRIAIGTELHPGVPVTITPILSEDYSRVVTEGEELAPRPQSKVVAIALPGLLEVLWRLPVVLPPELFFIGYGFAAAQKLADRVEIFAVHREGLAYVSPHRKCGLWSAATVERAKDFPA